MKRLQPLAPLGPVRAHQLPTLAIDSSLNRPTTAPVSPAFPATASPASSAPLTTPRSARTPRTDSSGGSQLPNVKRASGRKAESEEKEAEVDASSREMERRKQRDMERAREAQKEEQAKVVRRRSSSTSATGAAAASLSPLNSTRNTHSADSGNNTNDLPSPLPSPAVSALPVASIKSPETPRRGKEALSPLSPPSARRALPPLAPTSRATSDTANSAALTPTADKPKKEKRVKANGDKQQRVKSDKRKKAAARAEESKEEDGEPVSASGDVESASSADSSDSETEKEDLQADQELLHTLAVTEPLAAAPIIAAESAALGLSATQPLPSTDHLPHPPQFPPPLPFQPPIADTSRILSLYVGTWNLHGRPFPADSTLSAFLPSQPADIVCIGTEECDMSIERAVLLSAVDKGGKERWVRKVHAMIGQDAYVKVEEESMVAMHIVVFVRRELSTYVSGVDRARVATGMGNVIGNKGGVGVCMNVGGTSLLFINSHFAAHQHAVDKRNTDFWAISNKLNLRPKHPAAASSVTNHKATTPIAISLPPPAPLPARSSSSSTVSSSTLVTERFDRVFWLGDLNYRIEGTHRLVCHLLQSEHLQPLLNNDQLTRSRLTQSAFAHFHEQAITFKPTYKVDPNTAPTVYDSSRKQRVPGWTDRVLWRDVEGGGGVEAVQYGSCEEVRSSDHFPVYAKFRVRVDSLMEKEESKEAEVSEKRKQSKKKVKEDGSAKTAHKKSASSQPITATVSGSDPPAAAAHKLSHHSSMSTQGESVHSTVDSARAARGSVIEMSMMDGAADDGSPRRSVSAVIADAPIATEQDSKVCAVM